MKVDLVGDPSGVPDEGMKKIGRRLAEALVQHGVDARFVTPGHLLRERFNLSQVVHYVAGPTLRSFAFMRAGSLLNRDVRTVVSFTNPLIGPFASRLVPFLKPDLLTVPSAAWLAWSADRGFVAERLPISGVDCSRLGAASPDEVQAFRHQCGVDDSDIMLLHLGHLKADRNFGPLIELSGGMAWKVVVVASATTRAEAAVVRDLLDAGVHVVRGFLPDVSVAYHAADCYLFPTTDPNGAVSLPLGVLEALAAGTPVVSTPFDGLVETLGESSGLRYSSFDDLSELVSVIQSVLGNGATNVDIVASLDWKNVAARLLEAYQTLGLRNRRA